MSIRTSNGLCTSTIGTRPKSCSEHIWCPKELLREDVSGIFGALRQTVPEHGYYVVDLADQKLMVHLGNKVGNTSYIEERDGLERGTEE